LGRARKSFRFVATRADLTRACCRASLSGMTTPDLIGKKALVCGASQGIGEATARLLAARGAQVILLARNTEKLQAVLSSLPGSGHSLIKADLQNLEDLRTHVIPQIEKAAPVIIINNSGGPKGGPLMEAGVDEFEFALRGHVLAAHLILKASVPAMKAQGFGRVVNVISTSVKTPLANLGVSNTIRGAMASWAKTMANELGVMGITVNNVLPGYTRTLRFETLRTNAAAKTGVGEDQVEKQWKASIPVCRIGEPQEIAEAIVFLASPAASYISGVNLPVDGGRTPSL